MFKKLILAIVLFAAVCPANSAFAEPKTKIVKARIIDKMKDVEGDLKMLDFDVQGSISDYSPPPPPRPQ